MKKILTQLLLLLSCLPVWAQRKDTPYVMLVSFDAFRYDYVAKFNLPHFQAFIKNGSRAEALIPSFPSKTFPNHYTLVTGLYPGHHGLVDNSFYDPARREIFIKSNKKIACDPYYYGGMPLWNLAQHAGLKVAPFFWVGSEVQFGGLHPDYNLPYTDTVTNQHRVDKVLAWLRLPQKERPHFITLYFSSVDDAGHSFGIDSKEFKKAIEDADGVLGYLINGISATHVPVNIIIVSDHGMKEIVYKPDTYIYLDEIMNLYDSSVTVINNGTHAHIYRRNKSKIDSLFSDLKKAENNFRVYRSADFPKHWHYSNPRSGDIIITASAGKEITTKQRGQLMDKLPDQKWGDHGYDPEEVPEMRGIFYALGPNIRSGIEIPAFQNIHVYPFVARILGLKIPPVDGSIKVLQKIYKP